MRLKTKVTVVTGGNSGIGLGIAKKYIDEGAQVIISGRNENSLLDAKQILGRNSHP